MEYENQKFYLCAHCGNLVGMIRSAGVPIVCCGEPMKELKANVTEAAQEKHLPVIKVEENTVSVEVGDVAHPMIDEHYIEWIYLQTARGGQRKALRPGDAPKTVFLLKDDHPVAAFAYCNIHGLWKTVLE